MFVSSGVHPLVGRHCQAHNLIDLADHQAGDPDEVKGHVDHDPGDPGTANSPTLHVLEPSGVRRIHTGLRYINATTIDAERCEGREEDEVAKKI